MINELGGKVESIEKRRTKGSRRVPPQLYLVGSAVFHYLGPAFAVLLFARVEVAGVAWMRIVSASLVFGVFSRPWKALIAGTTQARATIVALGLVLALMNLSFYGAIDRLPLGTVAAIEFLGPIILALSGQRSRRNLLALVLAVAGVFLLADVRLEGEPLGFALAFANAALFTLYIVLAHRLARVDDAFSPIDRLGASMLVAAVAITPIGLGSALPALIDPAAVLAGIGVGITSSVIPYVFDQLAMKRVSRATYSLFVSLLPATATVIGIVVLRQIPNLWETLGVGLVVAGVLAHQERPAGSS